MDTTSLNRLVVRPLLVALAIGALGTGSWPAGAQTPAEAVATAEEAPQPLSPEELEILVARIALYPDELVALISAASLNPLQIVEAQRFLDDSKTKKDLKPKSSWDGSVVSLLNYPEIVKMMSDDLDWTQLFGEAIVNQQDDVLAAIQQLREQAVANGVIKTDEKVKVTKSQENGRQNIIIEPASTEVIYVPQYQPEMFYEPDYVYRPVSYYPEPYPYYWNPAATFFAGAVTGAIFAAAVDWNDGFWGGNWGNNNWNGGGNVNIDFDCNKCIIGSDFSGKLNINKVDWTKIDRNKINFDKNTFNKLDNSKLKDSFRNSDRTKLTNKANTLQGVRPGTLPGKGNLATKDIRQSTLDKIKRQPVKDFRPADKMARPGDLKPGNLKPGDKMARPGDLKPGTAKPGNIKPGDKMARPGDLKPGAVKPGNIKPGDKMAKPGNPKPADLKPGGFNPADKMARPNLERPVGKPKPGLTKDVRPGTPSPLGDITRGRDAQIQSMRGNKSMGGGIHPNIGGGGGGGGGSAKKFIPKHNMGGGRGGLRR